MNQLIPDPGMYLTAQEAADQLGVSVTTLYAYVSRKQIRSQAAPGSRARLYWRDDIDRLTRPAGPPAGDVLVPKTAITLITDQGPFYRGRSATELARTETLESVCGILWGPAAEGAFGPVSFKRSALYDKVMAGLQGASPVEKITALLPILERANPKAYDLSPAGYARTGAEMMRWFVTMITDEKDPTDEPLHEGLARRLKAPKGYADIIRRLLVLGADHELDPSTYAVRAVANSGVSVYHIAVAGLASAAGRRLTFGRAQALSQMFREIFEESDPTEAVLRRLREGEQVHGFGSRIYPHGDPRATVMMTWLNEALPDDPYLQRLNAAIAVAQEATDRGPDFVIPLSFVGYRLGLIGREGILLRVARMAGWIAHAMEQYHSQELVRPRTVYVGELPQMAGPAGQPNAAKYQG